MKTRGFASLLLLAFAAATLLLIAPSAPRSAAPPANAPNAPQTPASADPRLAKAWRFQQDLWTYVHMEGDASTVGFQHGYLLAPEIADALNGIKLQDEHDTGRP